MVSITTILSLLGCPGPDPRPHPPAPTAPVPAPDPWPFCSHEPRTGSVTLPGGRRYDASGRSVAVGDTDGDGCVEIAVGGEWVAPGYEGRMAVYLLSDPDPGPLPDQASAVFETDDLTWVRRVTVVGSQVVWSSGYVGGLPDTTAILAVDVPSEPLTAPAGVEVLAGRLSYDREPVDYSFGSGIVDCGGVGIPTICAGSINAATEYDLAGAVWLFDAPLVGELPVSSRRTKLSGDPGERAQMVHAEGDLDGDGLADLLIGAYDSGAVGVVALVSDPPRGDHSVWDVAHATVAGTEYGAQLGMGAGSTGDLDGDGHADLLLGAPIGAGGRAYVVTGPFAGASSVADAAITIVGTVDYQWTGSDKAIADFDGDGALDLAVGAPHSTYSGTAPGEVLVWPAPSAGSYTVDEAPVALSSGSAEPDAFGLAFAAGDVDGDGRADLVIGAPRDSRAALYAGSVTIVFGAGML